MRLTAAEKHEIIRLVEGSDLGGAPRRRTRKHTVVPLLQSVQTLRFRTVSSGRPAGPPRWQDAVADDRQSPDASAVHPHCQRPRERLSF